MSVLAVTGPAALPDRTLDYPRTASFTQHSQLGGPPPARFQDSYMRVSPATSSQTANISLHRHSRTVSSALLPADPFVPRQTPPPTARNPAQSSPRLIHASHLRQPSTASTMSAVQPRQSTTAAFNPSLPRRSTSSRSTGTNAPVSYVTLMRKQKATVWCDRSQNIDPRNAAAQRAAKQRATLEVNGSMSSAARTSTLSSGGVVGKIRHGGVPKAPGYSGNMSGAGVPMRLSANEMFGDDENDGHSITGDNAMVHARSGSGKSSASSRFRSGYPRPEGKYSGGNTPPNGQENAPPARNHIPEDDAESVEQPHTQRQRTESEDSFGEVKELSGPKALHQAIDGAKKAEDLRRRGSVDERTMSMGAGVRLFVANPDLDD